MAIKHKGWKLVEDFSSKFNVAPDLEALKAKRAYQRSYNPDDVRMDIRDTPSGGSWAGVYIRIGARKKSRRGK